MITRDNLTDVINSIKPKDKYRIAHTSKEYVVLILHTFNVGSWVEVILTNRYIIYQYVSKNGDCILESGDPCFNDII